MTQHCFQYTSTVLTSTLAFQKEQKLKCECQVRKRDLPCASLRNEVAQLSAPESHPQGKSSCLSKPPQGDYPVPRRPLKGEVGSFSGQRQWLQTLGPSSVQLGYYSNIWVSGAGGERTSETQDFYTTSLGLFLPLPRLVAK